MPKREWNGWGGGAARGCCLGKADPGGSIVALECARVRHSVCLLLAQRSSMTVWRYWRQPMHSCHGG
jgi:hypothetical protein